MSDNGMDYEFYILYSTRPVFSYSVGAPIFSRDERILVSGFLSALDSFAKLTMKASVESLSLSNTKIYFKQSGDFLLILIVSYNEVLPYVSDFFSQVTPNILKFTDALSKLPTTETTNTIENILREYQYLIEPDSNKERTLETVEEEI
ncbi:MAG: hypothetical protein ACXAC7_01135 [Candidatus Hodarchaeales archaeon]